MNTLVAMEMESSVDELIDVACPLCGSIERTLRFEQEPHAVVDCSDCGLTYVTPQLPPDVLLQRVYDESYWRSSSAKDRGYTDYQGDAELYLTTFRNRRAVFDEYFHQPGRVLDVGCAAGYFLRVMQAAGWEVAGIEPSPTMHAAAVASLGNCIHPGTLHDHPFPAQGFDLVTLWDVLEHTPHPVATLQLARQLLAPGGKLVIETQNINSVAARLLGRRWQHFKHYEHLVHFQPETIELALREAGLRIRKRTSTYAGKRVSPQFIAERAGKIAPWMEKLASPIAKLPLESLYVNPFDEMIIVAEREEDVPTTNHMPAAAVDQFAELEDEHWWFRGRREVYMDLLDHELEGARPQRVLDLGCGVGGFIEELAERADWVVPADTDPNCVDRASERPLPPNVEAPVWLSGQHLPFEDASFDMVCLFDVLEHQQDEAWALAEVARVLCPGGYLVVSVPAYPWLFANNDKLSGHYRRYTRASLRAALESAGFELERNTHANVLLAPLIIPIVLGLKLVESLFLRDKDPQHTNLSWYLPSWLHGMLARVFAAELPLSRRFDVPFGHSLFSIARR